MLGSVGGDGWLAVSQSCGVWSGQEQVLLHPAHLGTGPPPPPNIISILHNTAPGQHGKGGGYACFCRKFRFNMLPRHNPDTYLQVV